MAARVYSSTVGLFLFATIVPLGLVVGALLIPNLDLHLLGDVLVAIAVLLAMQLERAWLIGEVRRVVADDRLKLVQQIHDDIGRLRRGLEPEER